VSRFKEWGVGNRVGRQSIVAQGVNRAVRTALRVVHWEELA